MTPLFSLKKQNLALGLDIGSHAVKLCELTESGKGYQLVKLGSALLPHGALEDGVLQEPEAVARVITSLMANLSIKAKKVALSISGYSVIVKKINLPVMSPKELDDYIQSEAEQYIPFDIDDVYLDYQALKSATDQDDRIDIMLVAAKKDVVDGYLEMLRSIGLQAVVVDVDAFALENAFAANFGLDENVALVDVGASKMNINIVQRGTSVLARDVALGGRQLTEQIQRNLDLEFDDAEGIKQGFVSAEESQEGVERAYSSICIQWANEIKRALDFYYSNNPDDPVSKIVLSGGGAKIAGLTDFLSNETGIAVTVFNPFAKITIDSKIDQQYVASIAPEMALSVGLATRPVEV